MDLDARPYRIALQQAQAALARDQASYGNAVLVRDRNRTLAAQGLVAASTLTDAEALAQEGRTVAAVQWYMVHNHGTSYGDPEHLYVQPGGDFGDRFELASATAEGRSVILDLEPGEGEYVLSDLSSGPLLFATC